MSAKKREALERMLLMKMHPNIIQKFEQHNELSYSINGIIYDMKDEWKAKIKKLEDKNGFLVYHALFSKEKSGSVLILFVVSNDMKEWNDERKELYENEINAYVLNLCTNRLHKALISIKSVYGGVKKKELI